MFAGELDFWIPALALADDHSDPNTSPPAPPAGFAPAGLLLPAGDAEVIEDTDDMPGRWPMAAPVADWPVLFAATEVK